MLVNCDSQFLEISHSAAAPMPGHPLHSAATHPREARILSDNDDVSAVQVVIVIRKGADGSENLRAGGVLVPRRFEFDAL